jgi:hypothetical protein
LAAAVAPREAVVPVQARRPREAEPLAPAQLPVAPVLLPQEPELVVRLQQLVPAELPLAVRVEPLLSRQSFSAAMAGSTRLTRVTYEPVPRSR